MSEKIPKWKKVFSKLNIKRTVALTWSVGRGWTILTLFFLLLENICWLGTLYTLKLMLNKISKPFTSNSSHDFVRLITLSGAVAVIYVCVKGLSGYFNDIQALKVNQFIDKRIHTHTLSLDFGYYENPEYFDILKRAIEAGAGRPYAVLSSLLEITKNLVMLAGIASVLIAIDWMLLPLVALFVMPILLVRLKFSDKIFLWQRKNTGLERQASYLSFLITGDNSAKEIRAFSLGNYLHSKYHAIKERLISEQITLNRKRMLLEMLTTVLGTSACFGIAAYVIFVTLKGKTSVGDIGVFLVIFPQSFSIMQSLVGAITKLYQNNIYVNNIFELFDIEPIIEKTNTHLTVPVKNADMDIMLDKVCFKYPHSEESVLEDISITIPAGKIIALVGLNGAGKSTLIKLLCRLYDPVQGTIRFGDVDIKKYDTTEYRRQVSVVFQDFVKYNISVAENIWFGDIHSAIKDEEIVEASKNAGAHSFVSNFAAAYDTILGRVFDEGHEISVGQWQKLAIARAFYSHSRLVILDEATSALDAVSENELFQSFRQRIGSRSALVISHRLSTIKQADIIYVMANKRIVESGTHAELISLNGKYASLYKSGSNKPAMALSH